MRLITMDTQLINNDKGTYQVGLSNIKEAVISEHFMHKISHNMSLSLYADQYFNNNSLKVPTNTVIDNILPILIESSNSFISSRTNSAESRARKYFREYMLNTQHELSVEHIISELMLDQQFYKGSKKNISRHKLSLKVKGLIEQRKPINLIIPALPFKSSCPLKCRGPNPDLSEVSFLLGLSEVAKSIDTIYKKYINTDKNMSKFSVICDGKRFNKELNEASNNINNYQNSLRLWVNKLNIMNYVEILDYEESILNKLNKTIYENKLKTKKQTRDKYTSLLLPIFDPYNIDKTIKKAIEIDPDPEATNNDGRFIPLFRSLLYIINYKCLLNYSKNNNVNYNDLYREISRRMFKPYCRLSKKEINYIKSGLESNSMLESSRDQIFEFLRLSILEEAWYAAINYIAEIKSDRDLDSDPVSSCFPDHIRWTIHSKPGQLALLYPTTNGHPVQAWHGSAIFKRNKKNKIKLYTAPCLSIESEGGIPVSTVLNQSSEQPLFYIHPNIEFIDFYDFICKLSENYSRARKT